MGHEVKLNPVVQSGGNVNSEGLKATTAVTEVKVAVTDHIETEGHLETDISVGPGFSLMGKEKRCSGFASVTLTPFHPALKTMLGPIVSYNLDRKKTEGGAMACLQVMAPVRGDISLMGGACFEANNLFDI